MKQNGIELNDSQTEAYRTVFSFWHMPRCDL